MLPPTPLDDSPAPEGASCAVHDDRPAHAQCARCRAWTCTACTRVMVSGEALCARCEDLEAGTFPLEQRRELGLGVAVARTIAGVLLRPTAFFAQRTRERALWPALLFGLVLHVVASAAQLGWNLAFADRLRAQVLADPLLSQFPWRVSREFFLAELLLSPLTFLVGTYLMATLWWIALRAVGGARRPFHVVVRALCFAQSAAVLVPIVAGLAMLEPIGGFFGLTFSAWSLWLQIVAVSRMQGITMARGGLAFLLCFVLLSILTCVLATGLAVVFASQIRIPNV